MTDAVAAVKKQMSEALAAVEKEHAGALTVVETEKAEALAAAEKAKAEVRLHKAACDTAVADEMAAVTCEKATAPPIEVGES
eukprot:2266080-Prymnesium_polylepis.1